MLQFIKNMDVKNVEVLEVRNSTLDNRVKKIILQIKNGFNTFKFEITKRELKYDQLENWDNYIEDFTIKAVFYARNCCKNSPVIILNSENDNDRDEITMVLKKCLELKGNEIKERLEVL